MFLWRESWLEGQCSSRVSKHLTCALNIERTKTINSTRPLQLIKTPMVKLSLHTNLQDLAANVPPTIFPAKAIAITPIT